MASLCTVESPYSRCWRWVVLNSPLVTIKHTPCMPVGSSCFQQTRETKTPLHCNLHPLLDTPVMMDYKRDRVWTLIVQCHFNQNNEGNIPPFQVDVVVLSYKGYFGVLCRIAEHQICSVWTSMMNISLVQEDSCQSSLAVFLLKRLFSAFFHNSNSVRENWDDVKSRVK